MMNKLGVVAKNSVVHLQLWDLGEAQAVVKCLQTSLKNGVWIPSTLT